MKIEHLRKWIVEHRPEAVRLHPQTIGKLESDLRKRNFPSLVPLTNIDGVVVIADETAAIGNVIASN